MLKRLSLLFILVLLLSVMAGSFHRHDDGNDHRDCPICVAYHQQADSAYSPPHGYLVQRDIAETVYSRSSPTAATIVIITPANNRAPPA